ncbi:AMP-binding protein [Streptomyces sp. NPDC057638]|uniref:AMP-binding protein n=1 Tax=Streptomyces sp. NPDC057638 TaxID=3346190 RepID=UPI0036CE2FA4
MSGGGAVAFATSGTTGAPVSWLRSPAQLTAEAELLATVVGPVDQVVCYAPPRHLYGRIFGVELPRRLGATVLPRWDAVLEPLVVVPEARTLVVCLPSTWPLLLRAAPALAACRELVAVHSTAEVTRAAHRVVQRLSGTGFRALEVLGSTETGAVATRAIGPYGEDGDDWRLLPDVGWTRPAGRDPRRLTVSGPRLARRPGAPPTGAVTMPDLVVPTGPRSFRRTGRGPGLVKVNGVRCDLDRVERLVREALPGTDAVCVPLADEVRGEHYALYYASAEALSPAELRSRLAGTLGSEPAPKAVVRVGRIPRRGDRVLTSELPGVAPVADAADGRD